MKLFLFIATALFSLPSAQAASAVFSGTYKSGSYLNSAPAKLSVITSGSSVKAAFHAPGADCVITFGTGSFAGNFPNRALFGSGSFDLYQLPIVESCGDPRGFGTHRNLIVYRNAAGEIENVVVRGSSGKTNWTYFSTKR